jgi:ribonucleoside-diphosphate reductase alpha chain
MRNNEFDGIDSLDNVPDELKRLFVTTGDLSAKDHAGVQCALQKGVDSSISKTVNAPHESTAEDAREVFEYIYENGGKGVTYYRDGTRAKQVLTTRQDNTAVDDVDFDDWLSSTDYDGLESFFDSEEFGKVVRSTDMQVHYGEFDESTHNAEEIINSPEMSYADVIQYIQDNKDSGEFIQDVIEVADLEQWAEQTTETAIPDDRPDELRGSTHRVETGYGSLYVTVNRKDGRAFEVMATVGKSGATMEADTEAIARLISLALRAGVPVDEVVDQLDGIEADRVGWHNGKQITSVADGIAEALKMSNASQNKTPKNIIKSDDGNEQDSDMTITKTDGGDTGFSASCPDCGGTVAMKEGCETCVHCGWSKC